MELIKWHQINYYYYYYCTRNNNNDHYHVHPTRGRHFPQCPAVLTIEEVHVSFRSTGVLPRSRRSSIDFRYLARIKTLSTRKS